MFNKNNNDRLKINLQALLAFILIIGMVVGGIVGFAKQRVQADTTKSTVEEILENTTKKIKGTLLSDVVGNKEILAVHDKQISVLESNQKEMKAIQVETKQAITDLNKKIDSNQRDIMKVLLELKGDK